MRTKRDHSDWVIRLAGIVLCLTLLTTHLTSGLFARYTTSASGDDGASVAAFGFYVQDDEGQKYISLEQIKVPGDSQTVSICVSNGSGTQMAEVAMDYKLTLEIDGSMPLICSVQKNTEEAVSLTRLTNEAVTKAYTGSFEAAVSGTDIYTLIVTWPESYDDGTNVYYYNDADMYASGSAVAEVAVSIVAEQVD